MSKAGVDMFTSILIILSSSFVVVVIIILNRLANIYFDVVQVFYSTFEKLEYLTLNENAIIFEWKNTN